MAHKSGTSPLREETKGLDAVQGFTHRLQESRARRTSRILANRLSLRYFEIVLEIAERVRVAF